jgi:hypothetical protein
MNNGMPGETIQNTAQDVQTEAKILAQAQEGNGSNAIAKEQGDSGGGGVSPLRNEILKAERSLIYCQRSLQKMIRKAEERSLLMERYLKREEVGNILILKKSGPRLLRLGITKVQNTGMQ